MLLPIIQQEELTGMASQWLYKNQNPSYRCKFHLNFDQGKENLVRVRGYSSYPSSSYPSKMTERCVKYRGNGT